MRFFGTRAYTFLVSLPIVYNCSISATNVIAANIDATTNLKNVEKKNEDPQHLSMIGNAHLQHHPTFLDDVQNIINKLKEEEDTRQIATRKLGKKSKVNKVSKTTKSSKTTKGPKTMSPSPSLPPDDDDCDPADVQLLDYPQWQAEKGYWIGEYTFMQGDGNPFVSSSWNYPYDHYKGFITGEVFGNSYRQRNVFLYPPQVSSMCDPDDDANVVGNGECGVNGNTKVFEADQSATTCSTNEELGGDIEGPYVQGNFVLPTKTELVGKDNALVYQVFIPGAMFGQENDILLQSQLTTITKNPSGQVYRTRTAQSFDAFVNVGVTNSASYYRERKVDRDEFYTSLKNAIAEYNIRAEDLCAWDNNNNPIANVTGSFETCENHLEESFALGSE